MDLWQSDRWRGLYALSACGGINSCQNIYPDLSDDRCRPDLCLLPSGREPPLGWARFSACASSRVRQTGPQREKLRTIPYHTGTHERQGVSPCPVQAVSLPRDQRDILPSGNLWLWVIPFAGIHECLRPFPVQVHHPHKIRVRVVPVVRVLACEP